MPTRTIGLLKAAGLLAPLFPVAARNGLHPSVFSKLTPMTSHWIVTPQTDPARAKT